MRRLKREEEKAHCEQRRQNESDGKEKALNKREGHAVINTGFKTCEN